MNVISCTFSYLDKLPVFLQLAATFYSDVCLVARTPSPTHTQANLLPTCLGQLLTATQETISQDIIVRKSPNKLKFTALTLCIIILVDYWEEKFSMGESE